MLCPLSVKRYYFVLFVGPIEVLADVLRLSEVGIALRQRRMCGQAVSDGRASVGDGHRCSAQHSRLADTRTNEENADLVVG